MRRWLIAALVLLLARGRRSPAEPPAPRAKAAHEWLVLALLGAAAASAAGFGFVWFRDGDTQLLGLAIGLALAFLAAACGAAAKLLVPQTVAVEERPELANEDEVEAAVEEIRAGGEMVTRKRLLLLGAGGAAAAVGGALALPALSLGPSGSRVLSRSPWRRGLALVDEHGRPLRLDELEVGSVWTAFAAGAPRRLLASSLTVVRVEPADLDLPPERAGWAPEGVLAFSRICTHAGCAVSLFRYPTFEPTSPGPALVCPCHYSTFDVLRGGEVTFGPAGRPLPQLPLAVDGAGRLVAGGDFSGRVGPSWWSVRR